MELGTGRIAAVAGYGCGIAGGILFNLFSMPLPWMIGPMAAIIAWKIAVQYVRTMPEPAPLPNTLKNASFIIIGTVFGFRVTWSTVEQVMPYLLPFAVITIVLTAACVGFGFLFARWTGTDRISSISGFIPGGFAEMIGISEELGAKPGVVVFIHTMRLLTVISIIPIAVTAIFAPSAIGAAAASTMNLGDSANVEFAALYRYGWFLLPVAGAVLLRRHFPAPYIMVPMIVTSILQISGAPLPALPAQLMVAAQLLIGINLGLSVQLRELRSMGSWIAPVLLLLTCLLLLSSGSGFLLSLWTGMDVPTAILSTVPGGFVEMSLTAASVGADPVIVIALQLTRLYMIIGGVPWCLKRVFAAPKNASS